MPKTIGSLPRSKPVARGKTVAASDRTRHLYKDKKWSKASRYVRHLHGGVCLYCNVQRATLSDHFKASSTTEDFYQLDNLVPCCRDCHDALTRKYDACGGIYGNTREGKPDPRGDSFYRRCRIGAKGYAEAISIKRRKAQPLPPDWTPCC